MRPHMPPQIGLIFALFFAAISIVLFGSTSMRSTAQAQVDTSIENTAPISNSLITANAANVAVDGLDDLVIGIVNSEPTYVNESITFSATLNITDTTGLSFSWQFGDTQSASGRSVTHFYANTGIYVVKLYVSSVNEQREITKALNIIVRPTGQPVLPKKVDLLVIEDNPQALEAQKAINFLATVAEGTNVRYLWKFDDSNQTLTGSSVTRSFDQPGSYTVRIEAINFLGSAFGTFVINIGDAPPENLTFTYDPDPLSVGEVALFTADQTRGTNLLYEWQFFDGKPLKRGKSVLYEFTTPGSYEIHVTAWNRADSRRTKKVEYSTTVFVQAAPPSGLRIIPAGPVNPREPMTLLVFARSQVPLKLQYLWGDRRVTTKTLTQPGGDPLYQDEASHAYSDSGKYPVIVVASNEFGSISEALVAYVGVESPPQWPFDIVTPELPLPGRDLNFRIRDDLPALECEWMFIDQLAERGNGRVTIHLGKAVTHGFRRSGPHVVTIVCRSADGTIVREKDFVIIIGSYSYLPMISFYGSSNVGGPRFPIVTPTNTPLPPATAVPTDAPTATATPMPSATAQATSTPIPATPTMTATSTLIPTAPAPTATPIGPGGTIPGG